MSMNVRRPLTVVAATVASLSLAAGPASAHYCYHSSLTPQAVAGIGGSNGFMKFGDLAEMITGLCPEGVEMLADAAKVSVDTPINAHGLMAGGLEKQGRSNKAISHLDFAAIGAVEPEAYAACGREYPPPEG
jgi:hypothetical protein